MVENIRLTTLVAMVSMIASALMLAAPVRAEQPWEGIWIDSEYACTDENGRARAVLITPTRIEGASYVCNVVNTRTSGKSQWMFSMRCMEGGPVEEIVHWVTVVDPTRLVRHDRIGQSDELRRCDALTDATRSAIRDRHKLIVCESAGCRLSAVQWRSLDTASAWALGLQTADDADLTCRIEKGLEKGSQPYTACLKEQLAKPPVRISANCTDGSTVVDGTAYKISDAAREGAMRNGEMSGYWDTSPPYRKPGRATLAMMSGWFRLLCPTASADWNMKLAE